MEELGESDLPRVILMSAEYAHVKLDRILDILGEDGEEEENEIDG